MIQLRSAMRPTRWLAHLPLTMLPFLAAAVTEGPRLSREVAGRVQQRLAEAGQDWARVDVKGRDVTIRGVAPSRAAARVALDRAQHTAGVRVAVLRALITP